MTPQTSTPREQMRHHLGVLAEKLTSNGLLAELVGDIAKRYLNVALADAPAQSERVLAQLDDGWWWFWWAWGRPIGAVDDTLTTAPGCARAHVKVTLTKWGMSAYEEVAELLISEMVTNAVEASTDEHGHPIYVNGRMPLIVVRLVATADGVVLEVWDIMPTLPVVKNAAATDVRGRGMFLVQTLSYRWCRSSALWGAFAAYHSMNSGGYRAGHWALIVSVPLVALPLLYGWSLVQGALAHAAYVRRQRQASYPVSAPTCERCGTRACSWNTRLSAWADTKTPPPGGGGV